MILDPPVRLLGFTGVLYVFTKKYTFIVRFLLPEPIRYTGDFKKIDMPLTSFLLLHPEALRQPLFQTLGNKQTYKHSFLKIVSERL